MSNFFKATIPNTVSALRVGYLAHARYIIIPSTKFSRNFLNKLADCGVISHFEDYRTTGRLQKKTTLMAYVRIFLSYVDSKPSIRELILITKSSQHYYICYRTLQSYMLTRRGILILNTSRGILTAGEAVKCRIGGCILLWVLF